MKTRQQAAEQTASLQKEVDKWKGVARFENEECIKKADRINELHGDISSLQKQVEELDELLDEANAVRMCHADHEALLLKRMSVLEIALKKIANPIAYLKQEAEKEGGQLNGYAYELSNNASWLKTIAKEALEAINPQDNAKEAHS